MTPAQRAVMEGQIRARAILNDGFGYTLAAALAHIDAQAATIARLEAECAEWKARYQDGTGDGYGNDAAKVTP